jgi:hypothetical protein
MKKQTAVQLLKESIDHELKSGTKMVVNWDMYLAIEKQQIETAYIESDSISASYNLEPLKSWAKEYYNETYGGEK